MSSHEVKTWLIGYDICCVRRLRQVHKLMKSKAIRLQYSFYSTSQTDKGILQIMADLEILIDPFEDDVRAYHVPARCKVWKLGQSSMAFGVVLTSQEITALMSDNKKAKVGHKKTNQVSAIL